MSKSTIGTLLAIYGICSGLFQTFINYTAYADENLRALILLVDFLLNPLNLFYRPSILNILVIGVYPFAVIALGLYMIVSPRNKKRRAHT